MEEDTMSSTDGRKKKDDVGNDDVSFFKLLCYADRLDWVMMALGTFGSLVHGMAQPMGYLLLGKALDAFGSNISDTKGMVHALQKVVPFVWYMAFATFPAGILEIGCWMYSSERQVTRMRLAYLRAVLSQEVAAFDTELSTGKIITGISSHMSLIQDAIGEKLGHFLSCFGTFFSGVLIAFICCWEVSLLTLLVVPLILLIGASYTKKMNLIATAKMLYLSEATSIVEQSISQIKTVFAFVGENNMIKSFSDCMDKQTTVSRGEATIKGIGTGMFQTVTNCSWSLIIWVGAIVVIVKRATGGEILAAIMSILFGAISLTYAAPDLQIFNQAKVAGSEVFQLIRRKSMIDSSIRRNTIEMVEGNIVIRDVYFSYPSRDNHLILRGLSLSIPAGKTVALVGRSGCGKSTVLSLVARFYDPSRGTILIDNYNIKDLELGFLRRNIGVVSQEPCLFSGTIKDNLKVGNLDADDRQLEEASQMANAHSFISLLPDKYITEVGERGFRLSGGQKQRIAIARAILKNPPILLLDEATSALDSESEKVVQEAIEKAMCGRTVILIAHRVSTIVNTDMIAIVENGEVTEMGTHRSLVETSKFYNNLCNMQNISITPSVTESAESESTSIDRQNMSENIAVSEHNVVSVQVDKTIEQTGGVLFFRMWFGLRESEFLKLAIGSIAAAFSGISKPLFGYFIITIGVAYYKPDSKNKVGFYSIIFSAVGVLSLFTHIVQHYFFGVIGEKAMMNLRKALYSSVLRNELAWFEKPENSVGHLTSRIINDTSQVKIVISDRMSVIVQCISSIVIATIVSILVNWRMALVAWAVMPCHFIGGLIQAKSAKGFSIDSATAHNKFIALTSEATTNIKTVASFCYEDHILSKAEILLDGPKKEARKASLKYGVIQGVSLCLWNIAHAVALWYTTILVERGQASFENGIRAYQIFSLTVPSITELWTLIPTVIAAVNILTPTFETLDRKPEIEPDKPEIKLDPPNRIQGMVQFQNVNFKYPSRPEVTVLTNFSLTIEAGSKVALVGPSGAGKSSILALILRFYDTLDGKVQIDALDIRDYNLRWLRTQIGFVQQEPLLFSSSIRDNICYGNNMASEIEIVEVSKEANIHDFVSNLPNGYNTLVGEKGCQLSGGQKQRIAIARTLLKRPRILLLDEATSALDGESERSVVRALETVRNDNDFISSQVTQITVAHRLSTIVNSENIVVMDRGEIVEMGSHSRLSTSPNGLYSRLYQLQNLNENR